jgi:hypothetical protein
VNLLRPAIAQAKRTNPNNKQIPAIESKMVHSTDYPQQQRLPHWSTQRFQSTTNGNAHFSAAQHARI